MPKRKATPKYSRSRTGFRQTRSYESCCFNWTESNPEYKLKAKIKKLLSRSENDGVLNIHKNQLDDENYLAYMVNKFAPDDNGHVYRKIQALAYAGFEEIKSNFLNDDFTLKWDEIKNNLDLFVKEMSLRNSIEFFMMNIQQMLELRIYF